MTDPAPAYREVMGMQVPLALEPRIVEAVRATYPAVTDGIADHDAAVRAVVRYWFATTLTNYETQKAAALAAQKLAAAQADLDKAVAAAAARATADVALIKDAVPPSDAAVE